MKVSYSIFAILLSIFCIIYLLFYPQKSSVLSHSFSAKALAKETDSQNEHNTLSCALTLSMETTYHEQIAANDLRYYCISFHKNIQIKFTSTSFSKFSISLLTDTGKKIAYDTLSSKNTRTLTPSIKSSSETQRIFICLTNKSVQTCTFDIWIFSSQNSNKNDSIPKNSPSANPLKDETQQRKNDVSVTPKPNNNITSKPSNNPSSTSSNKTISNPDNKTTSTSDSKTKSKSGNETTSNPDNKNKSKSSPKNTETAILYPQFLSMEPGSTEKLYIQGTQDASNFIWLSSNPLTAAVSDGQVQALKEGIAIIYVCEENNPTNATSCFVRVIEGT